MRRALRREALGPLPASRAEVEATRTDLRRRGRRPTSGPTRRKHAPSPCSATRYVHFATHGLLDPHTPLNSSLALTVPATRHEGQENGLLQAWEIFEQVRLDADLVTLSACETALGAELAGEGLIGLTRAFHYAGARSVLASLWRVADDSTAALMARFYRHLRAGTCRRTRRYGAPSSTRSRRPGTLRRSTGQRSPSRATGADATLSNRRSPDARVGQLDDRVAFSNPPDR